MVQVLWPLIENGMKRLRRAILLACRIDRWRFHANVFHVFERGPNAATLSLFLSHTVERKFPFHYFCYEEWTKRNDGTESNPSLECPVKLDCLVVNKLKLIRLCKVGMRFCLTIQVVSGSGQVKSSQVRPSTVNATVY
mmetsp:Transcript_16668/g.32551  ORF Transcript_16668/g.32551 Transcript_16668/m.32551 type:complete len:138 (-) Transcript_16668:95-508(-)